MPPNKRKQLVAEARKIARKVESWVELSNAITDRDGGLIVRYFPDDAQRQAFLRSPEYEELNELLSQVIDHKGIYPRTSGGKTSTK